MFKESYDVHKYINFLLYSVDSNTLFDKIEAITVYRNKYKRLSETLPIITQSVDDAYTTINNFISVLEDNYSKYLNDKRILLFRNYYKQNKYDRLIFNSTISLSFIELETDDDDLWNDIITNIYYFCHEYIDYIYDDSKDSHKILTITIPVRCYLFTNKLPDIIGYNPEISLSFYDMIEEIPIVDDSIKDIFTSELKYLINNNRINQDKLFTELLEDCINLSIYDTSINDIRFICREIMSYLNKDNLHLVVHLQFRIFNNIFNNSLYDDSDFESILIKKLTTIMAIDVAVYNKSLDADHNELKSLLLAYNYCIIAMQDMIGSLINDFNETKIPMLMYRSQLFKSRNKIQERIDNICQS